MKEKGFTLIELLIVLSIMSILISIAVPLQIESLAKQSEKVFIDQLYSDVLLIQNQAQIRGTDHLRIDLYKDYYMVLGATTKLYAKREYPEGWEYTFGIKNQGTIKFNHTGTILNPRKIRFQTNTGDVTLVFPFGKGRFYIDDTARIHTN